jgi:hypothetical protein
MRTSVLCVSRFYKGSAFIKGIYEEGHDVYLLTSNKLHSKPWPFECIKEVFYMQEDEQGAWNLEHVIQGLAYKMRQIKIDVFISLDDFDVENTAMLREHFRIPGLGQTTARYFRDKLAMRRKAVDKGISVPAFTSLFHDEEINKYLESTPAPWILKPRGQASATGMKKLYSAAEAWEAIHGLADERDRFLIEKFAPGDVYHVDSLIFNGKVIFAKTSKYLDTPFEVAHGGGIFQSVTIPSGSADDKALLKMNAQIMKGFGMKHSASHTEFIKDKNSGQLYFLETSARVGGANIAELVEAASGINLWREWARLEIASRLGKEYKLPQVQKDYAGIIISLSRFKEPDSGSFSDPEICWRLKKDNHIGFIVKSHKHDRIIELLNEYSHRIQSDFHAAMPAPDKPLD